jgi:hypothetical protein
VCASNCTRGSKKKSAPPVARTTSSRRVKVPATLSNPESCTLSVSAQLQKGSGKVTVKFYKS